MSPPVSDAFRVITDKASNVLASIERLLRVQFVQTRARRAVHGRGAGAPVLYVALYFLLIWDARARDSG